VIEGTRVLQVAREGEAWRIDTTLGRFSAGTLVNCAGAWADRLCEQVGEPVRSKPSRR